VNYLCHEAVSRVDNNGGIMFGDDDDVEEYVKEDLKKQMELHRDAYALCRPTPHLTRLKTRPGEMTG